MIKLIIEKLAKLAGYKAVVLPVLLLDTHKTEFDTWVLHLAERPPTCISYSKEAGYVYYKAVLGGISAVKYNPKPIYWGSNRLKIAWFLLKKVVIGLKIRVKEALKGYPLCYKD